MTTMWKIGAVLLALCSLCAVLRVRADDVCASPFRQFMSCLLVEVDARLLSYQREASSNVQSSISQCFSRGSCDLPDFSNAKIDYFFSEPWASRIKRILSLVDNLDPRVQQCMLNNMKNVVVSRIDECIQKFGSPDIKDFQVPPLPDMKNLDISKLQSMVLNRMIVWNATLKCGESKSDDNALQQVLDCVSVARGGRRGGVCAVREQCHKQNIAPSGLSCSRRYDSVATALCTCSREEAKAFKTNLVSRLKSLKDLVTQVLDKNLRKCYESNGLVFPEEKDRDARKAIGEAILDIAQQGSIPAPLMDAIAAVSGSMRDITDEWRNAFCSQCNRNSAGRDNNDSTDVKRIRDALARRRRPSSSTR